MILLGQNGLWSWRNSKRSIQRLRRKCLTVKSIQFCDEIHAGLASMHKEMEEAPSQEKDKIRKILIQANAVSCNALGFECYPVGNNLKSSVIPSGYHVEVDFNKMAQALYNAGYRKAE